MGERLRSITSVAAGTRELDPESRKAVTKLVGLFLSLGFGNLAEHYRPRQLARKAEEKLVPESSAPAGSDSNTSQETEST